MASIETEDLIDGSSASLTLDGFSVTRAYHLKDCESPAEALALGPALFDFHPTIEGIQVVNKSVTPKSSKQYRLAVQYEAIDDDQSLTSNPNETTINIGTSVQQVETNLDVNKEPIVIRDAVDAEGEQLPDQGGVVSVYRPQTTISFSRREEVQGNERVTADLSVVGKINDSSFFGYPELTMLCTGITSSSSDGGLSYQTTYEFQYNKQTWVIDVAYTDDSNNPRGDASINRGSIIPVQVYERANFGALNLF